jgi:hypothetical protein
MTVTTTRPRTFATHIVLFAMRRCRQILAEYERDCAYDRERGHTPHYCVHGTNRWTDYDNICPGCEDGVFGLRIALQIAHDLQYQWEKRNELVVAAMKANAPAEIRVALANWASEVTGETPESALMRLRRSVRSARTAPDNVRAAWAEARRG